MPTTRSLLRAKRPSFSLAAGRPSEWGLFLREFLKHPLSVASIAPSSERVIRRMLAPVDWPSVKLFVEYGPGVGTFCNAVLERLPADAVYIAIDPNPDFIEHLRRTIRDPRFVLVRGSAADVNEIIAVHGFEKADYILSGLPFTTLPPGVGDQIACETAKALKPGGIFLVYQFRPKVRTFFEPHIPKIEHAIEWWNIPPAQLWWAHKE
jgi:phospholipid N-methyltransferase